MKAVKQVKKKAGATGDCNCPDPCANQPGGTMFFCEDGVMTPIAPPSGANGTIYVPTWVMGLNSNLPFAGKLSDLLAAITAPPPPGMALHEHVQKFLTTLPRKKRRK